MITRVIVGLGIYLIPLFILLYKLGVSPEGIKYTIVSTYIFMFIWGSVDNDFSKLREFGYDENGKKIDKKN